MPPINPVRADPAAARAEIRAAIREASTRTGVSFQFLIAQAEQESGYKPEARAATSSAGGLYQFIDSTWLRMMREHGHKYGVSEIARSVAPDAEARASVLALRDDPRLSAAMAAEYARSNHDRLAHALRREVTSTDLYLAHFLGPGGAIKFLVAMPADSLRPAAELLPEAAAANRGVFFDASGRSRSIAEIYDRFAAKFDPGRTEAMTSRAGGAPAEAARAPHAENGPAGTHALEAVLRRTALAALAGNVLSPTVIAALATLDLPDSATGPAAHGQQGQRRRTDEPR